MTCDCNNNLILEINQGCSRSYGFTINQKIYVDENGTQTEKIIPLDLSDIEVIFQVKEAPYFKLKPLISKVLNETENNIGFITDAVNGKFQVYISLDDTLKLPPNDYALCIYLKNGEGSYTNISGEGNNFAIFRVCTQ